MGELKEGIRLNHAAPRLSRANRRPLYIAIGAALAVCGLLVWAWVIRLNMKTQARLRATAVTQATPATNALRDLSQRWQPKVPPPAGRTLSPPTVVTPPPAAS